MKDHDFRQLDKRIRALRATRERDPSGTWALSDFLSALVPQAKQGSDSDWERRFALLAAWRGEQPESVAAHVVEAAAWRQYAWRARGNTYAREVQDSAWPIFRERLAKARAALDAVGDDGRRCPDWYEESLWMAINEAWPKERFDRLFEEAVAQEPTFFGHYFARAYYLHPRWYGSAEALDAFATQAAERTRATEGESLYARIYWSLYGNSGMASRPIFTHGGANWARMHKGFQDLVARYPSAWNRQAFAMYACGARDVESTRTLLASIAEPIDGLWRPGLFEQCRDWIRGGNEPTADIPKSYR
ncbi:MAG: DUF4034 domain-containing protein [bacterium]